MALDFRYRRLGYVALNVSDIGKSADFYESLVGLAPAGEAANGEKLFRCTNRHHDVVLHQSGAPGLRRVGWEMETAEDTRRIARHLSALGIEPVSVDEEECAALGVEGAIRVTEPNTGATFEYYSSMPNAAVPFRPTVAKIARLGHVVLAAENHKETERFFIEELNFRASDRIDGAVTFLRCFPNPLHHSFGLSNAGDNHLNHVNFMVTDMDDIGRALWRMRKNDVPIVFGPGRHPPSGSVFLYFLDPDGMTVEYSYGMEEFPEHNPREPRLLPPGLESIDYWGAMPAPEFGSSGKIEPLAG